MEYLEVEVESQDKDIENDDTTIVETDIVID